MSEHRDRSIRGLRGSPRKYAFCAALVSFWLLLEGLARLFVPRWGKFDTAPPLKNSIILNGCPFPLLMTDLAFFLEQL